MAFLQIIMYNILWILIKEGTFEMNKKEFVTKELRNNIIISVLMTLCFILFTYLVGHLDVARVGEAPEAVGFSKINATFYGLGYHKFFYILSELLGYAAILVALFFVFVGAYQLITGKSLKAVDGEIYILGGFYALVLFFYALFEKVIINYRPYILDEAEGPEASYPSSHTVLAMCIFMTAAVLASKYIKVERIANITKIVLIAMMAATILFRLLSGVHWFTDIVGGMLLSTMLFSYFTLALIYYKYYRKQKADR